jgi:hypothetical protein
MTDEQRIVDALIADLKEITEYHLAGYRFKWNGKQVIRRTMAARLDRLTFDGFGARFPVVINDNRKKK